MEEIIIVIVWPMLIFGIVLAFLYVVDQQDKRDAIAFLREQQRIEDAKQKAMMNRPQKKTLPWWQFLDVDKNATRSEVNKAYRRKALVMHPDRGGSDKMMASLNKARELGLRNAKQ